MKNSKVATKVVSNGVLTTSKIENAMQIVAKSVISKIEKSRKELTGLKFTIGLSGTDGKEYQVVAPNSRAVTGYNKLRSLINDQTNKYFNEVCFLEIEGERLEFLGGKFSNTLLKVLELATKEYTNGGNHLIIHDDFDDNFQKIKEGFLPNVSVVDLLPAVIAVSKLGKKEIAYLSEAISKQSSFSKMLEVETNNELLA